MLTHEEKDAIIERLTAENAELRPLRQRVAQLEEQVKRLEEHNRKLEEQVRELLARLNMNSSNSSKPPSSDGYSKPKPVSLREKSGKKPGGQRGHKGAGLKFPKNPDKIIPCIPSACKGCDRRDSCPSRVRDKRSVLDVQIKTERHDYEQIERDCPKCGRILVGSFPNWVTADRQYGLGVRALALALTTDGAVSIERTHSLMQSLTGLSISTGTIARLLKDFPDCIRDSVSRVREALLKQAVVNCDETGMRVGGELHWLHNVSTAEYTLQTMSKSRGFEGMKSGGFLSAFKGIVVNDCFASYWKFPSTRHGLCNAHLLRELKGIVENDTNQKWAKKLIHLLLHMKKAVGRAIEAGEEALSRSHIAYYRRRFLWLARWGADQNPLPERKEGQRGKLKRSKARALCDRLVVHMDEWLLFLRDFRVPFTNNQAERDLRPAKIKQKVSGCFRTIIGSEGFGDIRSFLSTAKKQGVTVFQAILYALQGHPLSAIPLLATE